MTQTRRASAIEAVANVIVGFAVAVAAQAAIFPLFGFHASHEQHIQIAMIFTAISLIRSYAIRRLFNAITRWATS